MIITFASGGHARICVEFGQLPAFEGGVFF
jgi:hypothetical protein